MRNWFARAKARVLSAWSRFKAWAAATVLAILAALGLVVTAQDNSVTVSWDNATQYEDGSVLPVSEIQSTELFRASYPIGVEPDGSATFEHIASVTPDVTSYEDTPGNGQWCYHATHVATNGAQSGPSNTDCVTVDNRIPGAPQNVTVQ